MFSLKASPGRVRRREGAPCCGCEVIMSHPKNTGGQLGIPVDQDPWKSSGTSTDWEADTDVMPPEYCRQLLKISRQLKQAE